MVAWTSTGGPRSSSNGPFVVVRPFLPGLGHRLRWLLLRQWYAQTRIIGMILSLIWHLTDTRSPVRSRECAPHLGGGGVFPVLHSGNRRGLGGPVGCSETSLPHPQPEKNVILPRALKVGAVHGKAPAWCVWALGPISSSLLLFPTKCAIRYYSTKSISLTEE